MAIFLKFTLDKEREQLYYCTTDRRGVYWCLGGFTRGASNGFLPLILTLTLSLALFILILVPPMNLIFRGAGHLRTSPFRLRLSWSPLFVVTGNLIPKPCQRVRSDGTKKGRTACAAHLNIRETFFTGGIRGTFPPATPRRCDPPSDRGKKTGDGRRSSPVTEPSGKVIPGDTSGS